MKATIITREGCTGCEAAKAWLTKVGYEVFEHDVNSTAALVLCAELDIPLENVEVPIVVLRGFPPDVV